MNIHRILRTMGLLMAVLGSIPTAASVPLPGGVIAVSAADGVTLIAPGVPALTHVPAGTVGFLFPAPGGLLMAPDLMEGRTTVIDLQAMQVRELVSGVTQPHFGPYQDRYLVVAGDLVFVSWPERSLIHRMHAEITSPWQVFFSPEGLSVLVFERTFDGQGPASLTAMDLGSQQVVGKRTLGNGVERVDVGLDIGLVVTADAGNRRLELIDPATMVTVNVLQLDKPPRDAIFAMSGERLLAAAGSTIIRHKLKRRTDRLDIKPDEPVDLGAEILRLALAPDQRWVAAITATPEIVLVDSRKGTIGARWPLKGPTRDVIWCDQTIQGPTIPVWSDQGGGPNTADPEN